jgi:hypothetical protein
MPREDIMQGMPQSHFGQRESLALWTPFARDVANSPKSGMTRLRKIGRNDLSINEQERRNLCYWSLEQIGTACIDMLFDYNCKLEWRIMNHA